MTFDGHNGSVDISAEAIEIQRTGMVARAAFGKDVPVRTIPLSSITGVQIKPASRLTNGWLRVLVGGETPPELTTATAAGNNNTVLFTSKQRAEFERLHGWLETVVAKNADMGMISTASADDVAGSQQAGRLDKRAERLKNAADRHAAGRSEAVTGRESRPEPEYRPPVEPPAWKLAPARPAAKAPKTPFERLARIQLALASVQLVLLLLPLLIFLIVFVVIAVAVTRG